MTVGPTSAAFASLKPATSVWKNAVAGSVIVRHFRGDSRRVRAGSALANNEALLESGLVLSHVFRVRELGLGHAHPAAGHVACATLRAGSGRNLGPRPLWAIWPGCGRVLDRLEHVA